MEARSVAGRFRLGSCSRRTDRCGVGAQRLRSAERLVTYVIAAAAVVLLIAIGLIAFSRRPRQDAGLTSFRRHIDALSPEARREVHERVRRNKEGEG